VFDERVALKVRLEQLADSEEKIIREFRKERESIFKRLREMDKEEAKEASILPKQEMISFAGMSNTEPVYEKKRRGRRSKSLQELRETAILVLKEQNEPIRGIELQRQIEEKTGRKIANMTTFMVALEKENHHVRKLGRGLYIYEYEG